MSVRQLEIIDLHHADGTTALCVGRGLLSDLPEAAADAISGRRAFVVTSAPIAIRFQEELQHLAQLASDLQVLEVPDGEAAKTAEQAASLWRRLSDLDGKRDSVMVALGGGSVGDLAGFVASTFVRGIDFVQLPTTLLAQVDAAIGGKNGIDLPTAKNIVGTVYQPKAVVCDVDALATLQEADFRAGLFEVIKKAALLDAHFFGWLEHNLGAVIRREPDILVPAVAAAVRCKASVVEQDAKESGLRRVLNFGHTLAHAIETASGFRGMRHGEAVGWGMRFALQLGRSRGCDVDLAQRLEDLITRVGLPPWPDLRPEDLLTAMKRDKKAREEGLYWVLAEAAGQWRCEVVPPAAVAEELRGFVEQWVTAGC